jgi:hypothetical protein
VPFSEVLQLHMPSLFPLKAFEEFVNSVRGVALPGSEARREFGGASNLIGWRFRACVEDKEGYMASWRQYGADVSFDVIYIRERHLFATFVSGLSCIEAAVYACYALASHPNVFGLPFDEKIRQFGSGPRQLKEKLQAINPSIALVSVLEELVASDQWSLWKNFRNTMTHRSNLPRIVYAAIGGPLPPENPLEFAATWSSKALSGDEATFNEMLSWLAGSLERLLLAGAQLANRG